MTMARKAATSVRLTLTVKLERQVLADSVEKVGPPESCCSAEQKHSFWALLRKNQYSSAL